MFNPKIISVGLALISWFFLATFELASAVPSLVKNGTYLYGQSSKPSQIGKDYLILKVKDGQVGGAVYRPQSEFYCFTGQVQGEQLKLSFIDPSSGAIYKHEIGIRYFNQPIASEKLPLSKLSLDGFEPLEKLGEIDHQILNACLDNVN